MLGVESKNGRVPITRFASGSLHNDGDDALRLMMNRANDSRTVRETNLGDGRVQLDWSMTGGRRHTERYASDLSRALLKSALECGWLDHGKRILDPSLDHVRQAVLGARRDGYIVIAAKADPDDVSVTLTYDFTIDDDGNRGVVVGASYFGVVLATDSRAAQPRFPLPDDVATVLAFQGQPA